MINLFLDELPEDLVRTLSRPGRASPPKGLGEPEPAVPPGNQQQQSPQGLEPI